MVTGSAPLTGQTYNLQVSVEGCGKRHAGRQPPGACPTDPHPTRRRSRLSDHQILPWGWKASSLPLTYSGLVEQAGEEHTDLPSNLVGCQSNVGAVPHRSPVKLWRSGSRMPCAWAYTSADAQHLPLCWDSPSGCGASTCPCWHSSRSGPPLLQRRLSGYPLSPVSPAKCLHMLRPDPRCRSCRPRIGAASFCAFTSPGHQAVRARR